MFITASCGNSRQADISGDIYTADMAIGGELFIDEESKKHVDYFYALDYFFLAWCQDSGYVPADVDLNAMQEQYVVLFGGTEDGNNIAFMDYYDIPQSAYKKYWDQRQAEAAKDLSGAEGLASEYKTELAFDAWFSDETIPADQDIFINPAYKYEDPKSVFIRCPDDNIYTNRFYTINGFLIRYVGEDNFAVFKEKYAGTKDFNILNFIDYFNIEKDDFDAVFSSEKYHSCSLPYKSEYLFGSEEQQNLYLKKHPIND